MRQKCDECSHKARLLVLVPWINVHTRKEGAEWIPFCARHWPNAENWKKKELDSSVTDI